MRKILVLDDNPDILKAITFVIGKRSETKVVAINDASLLPLYLKEYKPDMLLMDIALGDYDGRELCNQIKHARTKEERIPVILFTAQTYPMESIQACKADAFLEKPFQVYELNTIIDKFLPY